MSIKRPYIPLAVRVQVAARQIPELTIDASLSNAKKLRILLDVLFGVEKSHLDHCPALILRKYSKRTGRYTPDANDPDYLIYRTGHDHHIKTHVRGDGAQFSDTTLRNRERRRQRKKKPTKKIANRRSPWPTGRKLQSRGFRDQRI